MQGRKGIYFQRMNHQNLSSTSQNLLKLTLFPPLCRFQKILKVQPCCACAMGQKLPNGEFAHQPCSWNSWCKKIPSLKLTYLYPLNIDPWNLGDSYWKLSCSGAFAVSFRECNPPLIWGPYVPWSKLPMLGMGKIPPLMGILIMGI